MNVRAAFWSLMLLLSIMLLGCEPPKPVAVAPSGPPGPPPPPGAAPPPPPDSPLNPAPNRPAAPSAAPLPIETKVGGFAGTLDDLAARPPAPPSSPTSDAPALGDPNLERVKAEKGVGIKGRSLDEYEGAVVTPVKAFFAAKERIAFEVQFPHAYNLYKASDGTVPKDFEDLQAKVLQPNQIKLPLLPPGHKYVWDAGKEELQVERPRKQ